MRMLAQFPMMAALAALVYLVGCSDEVNIVPPDGDGDQYSAWTKEHAQSLGNVDAALKFGDCADSDPAVNPGAQEICDGKDNDCDGLTDAADDSFMACSDENACTDLTCSAAGQCATAPVTCDDGNECTTDSCDPMTGCATAPVTCDDGNECTTDSCDPMTGCAATPNDGACDDSNACTTDTCNPDTGTCDTAPVVCNDGNVCTTDTCSPATGCVTENNTGACDDGDACTTDDACFGGACISTTEKDCDDSNACTDDSCDAGVCANSAVVCDDSNACTTDSCDPLVGCKAELINCDDANPCTTDSCSPTEGCVHMNNTAGCDDGNTCTTEDFCLGGKCIPGATNPCDDSNACTTDSCDPATGCTNTPVVCNDMNPCTDDSCSPVGGCIVVANSAPCDDGDACTTGDMCAETKCQPGALTNCDDGDPCTVDACDKVEGCASGAVTGCCTNDTDCVVSRSEDLPSNYAWGCTVESPDAGPTGSCVSCLDKDLDNYCDLPLTESNCSNGFDENGNGLVDCDDNDCTMNPVCVAPCKPECTGKECGPDGCDGTCGVGCNVGDKCDSNGDCQPEPRLMLTWEAPTSGVPQTDGSLVLLAKCYDEDGMTVVPWGVKASGPTSSSMLTWTATDWFVPAECRAQVVEVTDGKTNWYANGLYGVLSYLWDGLTVDDVKGDGSGWPFWPWTDSDGDGVLDAADPCPYSGSDSCLP